MAKKGGDMCLLQMGMDVTDSETEKKKKGGVPRRKRQNHW